ncbi:MAG: hypothetical protein UV40_C0016G0011 [Parcubacteria group bacterium GW2011_GWA1_42_7]|nr:MAG: hypothetical protein UV34_C0001G0034 [Parcubacteria group bacterium GW2011_GWB1_42_6]KKS69719.1 MAG: hypothetical protein UV40_C0016G0011 [Parcubacteria group bacterium GW2011_GWA1_42_7]KKS92319.1 MAG: hypothetical protein UV67_C0006G0035 [Parcubacteria group bacterium GW2011_GWC1_43_12]
MAIIRKKIWPGYLELIESGRKKYDFRLDDFEIKEGDTIIFEEWDPKTKKYTGRKVQKKAGYIGKLKIGDSFWSEEEIKEKGIKIISLE